MTEEVKRRTYSAPGETARTMGRNVARLRDARSLSTTKLSAKLQEAGVPMQPSAITRMEKGERRPTVDELMALAVVLGVNPSALLLPPTTEGEAELSGRGKVPASVAWKWVDGKRPLDTPPGDDGSAALDFRLHARPEGARTVELSTAEIRAAYRSGQFNDYPPEARKTLGAMAASRPGDKWNPKTGDVIFAEEDQEEEDE